MKQKKLANNNVKNVKMDEFELYKKYLKDWAEVYVHFCWHKNETPKLAWDRNIFKEHFTFERWKKDGFTKVNTNTTATLKNGQEISVRKKYKIFHFVDFDIKYSIDETN